MWGFYFKKYLLTLIFLVFAPLLKAKDRVCVLVIREFQILEVQLI